MHTVRACPARVIGSWIVSAFLCAPVLALPPHLSTSQLYHTQWTALDGAPTGIEALAQTRDGYIWMASTAGLFRFDGVQFERVAGAGGAPLLSNNLYALWAPPEGGLWIGHRFGGASFLQDGQLTQYAQREGLPSATLRAFARDPSRTLWAATSRGLLRLVNEKWLPAGPEWNVPPGVIHGLKTDRKGTLWMIAGNTILFLRSGAQRFEPTGVQLEDASAVNIFVSRDAAWAADTSHAALLQLRVPDDGKPFDGQWDVRSRQFDQSPPASFVDRNEQLWYVEEGGVHRMPLWRGSSGNIPKRYARNDRGVGLTGQFVFSTLEDREGNIWFGTSGGLDKFRAPALVQVPFAPGAAFFPLAPAADGGMWLGLSIGEIFHLPAGIPGKPHPVRVDELLRLPKSERSFDSFYQDPAGDLWVGRPNALWHLHAGKWIIWKRPVDEDAFTTGETQSMAMDAAGVMWVTIARVGVYRIVDGAWSLWGGIADLPREPATILSFDKQGRLWFGYVNSRVAMLEGDRLMQFSLGEGLEVGTVLAVAGRGDNLWVGGDRGLARFDGRRFHSVSLRERTMPLTVTGIVELADGDLWLSTGEGAVRIAAAEVGKLRAEPAHSAQYTLLNHLDGMPGTPFAIRPLPSMVASADGKLWFSTSNGVAWLDPQQTQRNEVVPDVLLKSITADGKVHELWGTHAMPARLPARTRNLQISYTAPSFSVPERVQFRYQLVGNDTGWQDVGTRREAYYTDLKPGRYRFHVIGSNNDGVWNQTGASVDFVIPPTFLQSGWFVALCVAAALGLVGLLFQLRVRQVKAHLRWRLEERLVERERIARELHDTFLQGVQGLMLRFQNAAEHIPEHEPARQLMEQALDRADGVLADGRDTVMSLRDSTQAATELPQAVKMFGDALAQDYGVAFDLSVDGAPRALHPVVREEAYRVAAQALANAFQHAQATRIRARITYGRRSLALRVTDDGKGFDTSHVPAGHWGLQGMRERASRIRSRLVLTSQIGEGTSVELRIPASVAFSNGTH